MLHGQKSWKPWWEAGYHDCKKTVTFIHALKCFTNNLLDGLINILKFINCWETEENKIFGRRFGRFPNLKKTGSLSGPFYFYRIYFNFCKNKVLKIAKQIIFWFYARIIDTDLIKMNISNVNNGNFAYLKNSP